MLAQPLNDLILVRRRKSEEQKSGLILKPNTAPTHWEGEVLAVGPGKVCANGYRVAPTVFSGSVVAYPPHTAFEVEIDGEKFDLIAEPQLLATIIRPPKE